MHGTSGFRCSRLLLLASRVAASCLHRCRAYVRARCLLAATGRGCPMNEPHVLAQNTLALVLAGGNGTRLGELTRGQCKPAIPFGGHFRNIDFTLSNCVNSKIRRIGVLTQYKAQTLIDHVTNGWNFLPRRLNEFVDLWPAQQRLHSGWYAGTADAVYQNLDLVAAQRTKYTLVLAGDH